MGSLLVCDCAEEVGNPKGALQYTRSPPGPAQAQQKPPGARPPPPPPPPPPPHCFRLDPSAAPPSSNWVNLWLSDLHSSLMDAIRKGVSLKKMEVDVDMDVDEG